MITAYFGEFGAFLCKLGRAYEGATHGGHVSDVTLYTASRRLLCASLCFCALICHVGDVTPMRYTLYVTLHALHSHAFAHEYPW